METRMRGTLRQVTCIVWMVLILLCLAACGTAPSVSPSIAPPPVASAPVESNSPVVDIPGGFQPEGDAMFAVVLNDDADMGEPAKVIDARYAGEGEANYFVCLIPLREGLHFSLQNVSSGDRFYTHPPYTVVDEFTAKPGEYYRIEANINPEDYTSLFMRIVAEDGAQQGSIWLDSEYPPDSNELVVSVGKLPDGLDESNIRLASGMVAGAVWRFGIEQGWRDEWGHAEAMVTPQQLALSRSFCEQFVHNLVDAVDYGASPFSEVQADIGAYDDAIFPGVDFSTLPDTDGFTDFEDDYFPWVNYSTQILFSCASADGKTGHVVVHITGEAGMEDMYRVDWVATEPFDLYRPFRYELVGVQPLERFVMGGRPYEEFYEKYLGAHALSSLAELGIAPAAVGYLEKQGIWAADETFLLRCTGIEEFEYATTYVLLSDDEGRITYLAADYEIIPHGGRPIPDGWTDLGIIAAPPDWTYTMPNLDFATVEGNGVFLSAGWLMADSVEAEVASCGDVWQFTFDDGHVGYMLYFDDYITWLRNDWMMLTLHHDGDLTAFRKNQELVMNLARTLQVRP